jgi:hypothetical protein
MDRGKQLTNGQGANVCTADTCVRYLTSKQEFLRYDQALAAGWPIATGVVEGACRHLTATGSTSPEHDGTFRAPKPSSPCAQ